MPWTSLTPLLVWAILFIPFSILLMRSQIRDRLTPVLLWGSYLAANLYFMLVVNWALLSYWLRFLPVIIAFAYVIRYFMSRLKHLPWLTPWKPASTALRVGALVILVASGVMDGLAIRSYAYPETPKVWVQYPAQTGMYVVTNGGNGLLGWGMSDTYRDWLGRQTASSAWQAYAVDIMEIRTNGMVSDQVLDNNVNHYEGSINEPLRSPCPGMVMYKDFSHPDVKPFSTPSDAIGNRVVIRCVESDYYVTVAGLYQKMDLLEVGQFVSFDNIIGYIGTSGTPAIPHLHIYANLGNWDESAPPLPIGFEGNYAVRNKLYIR